MKCFRKQESGVRSQKIEIIKPKLKVFILTSLFCILYSASHASESRPFLTDKDQFNYAQFLYKQGHYQVAAREFGRVIEYFPESPLIPMSHYMIGDAYLCASMYKEAENQLQQFMKNFPDSGLNTEASLKLEIAKTKIKEASLFSAPKLPRVKAQPEFRAPLRAVQVALFEGKNYAEVDSELDRLKAAGIDTVILRVFHNKGDRFYPFITPGNKYGVYFETKESPVVEDVLGPILGMAHKKGLKVFAWMTTRYADYGMEEKEDTACKAYDFNTKGVVRCKGLDIFNEDAVYHLERIFQDLATYPIDGILFQDDLVLKHNEGFGSYSEALYKRDTGKRLLPAGLYMSAEGGEENPQYTPEFWRWAAWKNKRLLHVAMRIKAIVKRKNPHAKFVINLMYESVSNPTYAMAWLSQSLDEAVKRGFDYYAIMAYHRQMQDELKKAPDEIQAMIEKIADDAVKIAGKPEKVIMKFQTIDWNTSGSLPDNDVIALFKKVQELDNISLAVAPYRRDFPFEKLGERKRIVRQIYP